MADVEKTLAEKARDKAEFDALVERERLMDKFRRGDTNAFESEMIIAQECAKGDVPRRAAREKAQRDAERETAERNARSRGY
jgi:hypothetical protein